MKLKLPALPSRRRLLVWLGEFLLLALLIVAIRTYHAWGTARGPAPAIAAQTLAGDPLRLADLRGRPVLVYFWGSWCPICRAQQETIADVARDYPVIAIAKRSGTNEEIARYAAEHDWRVTIINDIDGQLNREYGVRAVPTSFIVDPAGMIRTVEVGYTTEIGLRLRLWWAEHIGGGA